jgi:SAM-dependent methyltransferase
MSRALRGTAGKRIAPRRALRAAGLGVPVPAGRLAVPALEDAKVDDSPEAGAPAQVDVSRPHPARVYDYYLGGKDNFAADRELAEKTLAVMPAARTAARENRAFLGRAVRFLAGEAGVRQFLDIGAGLPAAHNVHEVAQAAVPKSRVVYVDNDPLVIAHLRDPAAILSDPAVRGVLDLSQPVALLLVAVLHFVPDEDKPAEAVAALLDALAPGSYLVASHATHEHDPAGSSAGQDTYRSYGVKACARDSADFARLAFPGLDLVPPGVVLVSEWRPGGPAPRPAPAEVGIYGGVGRKR